MVYRSVCTAPQDWTRGRGERLDASVKDRRQTVPSHRPRHHPANLRPTVAQLFEAP
ncbi:MAG: hypothetical protein OXC02_08320 [Rhodobacteraceae bacterium]|nr:hypothetical protein [Paracoccaceae bacterium]